MSTFIPNFSEWVTSILLSIQTLIFTPQALLTTAPAQTDTDIVSPCLDLITHDYEAILTDLGITGEKRYFLVHLNDDNTPEIIVNSARSSCGAMGHCASSVIGKFNDQWTFLYSGGLSYGGTNYTPTGHYTNGYQDLHIHGIYSDVNATMDTRYGRYDGLLKFDGRSYQIVSMNSEPITPEQ